MIRGFPGFKSVCLWVNDHLNGVHRVAEYFLQNGQIVSVHGGNFSLFKLGGEPGRGDRGDQFKTLIWQKPKWLVATFNHSDWPPRTASYLQGLRCADGLHLFLAFVISIRLYQTVEDDAFYTPGESGEKTERCELSWRNLQSFFKK